MQRLVISKQRFQSKPLIADNPTMDNRPIPRPKTTTVTSMWIEAPAHTSGLARSLSFNFNPIENKSMVTPMSAMLPS